MAKQSPSCQMAGTVLICKTESMLLNIDMNLLPAGMTDELIYWFNHVFWSRAPLHVNSVKRAQISPFCTSVFQHKYAISHTLCTRCSRFIYLWYQYPIYPYSSGLLLFGHCEQHIAWLSLYQWTILERYRCNWPVLKQNKAQESVAYPSLLENYSCRFI